jgi:hypothetical protein
VPLANTPHAAEPGTDEMGWERARRQWEQQTYRRHGGWAYIGVRALWERVRTKRTDRLQSGGGLAKGPPRQSCDMQPPLPPPTTHSSNAGARKADRYSASLESCRIPTQTNRRNVNGGCGSCNCWAQVCSACRQLGRKGCTTEPPFEGRTAQESKHTRRTVNQADKKKGRRIQPTITPQLTTHVAGPKHDSPVRSRAVAGREPEKHWPNQREVEGPPGMLVIEQPDLLPQRGRHRGRLQHHLGQFRGRGRKQRLPSLDGNLDVVVDADGRAHELPDLAHEYAPLLRLAQLEAQLHARTHGPATEVRSASQGVCTSKHGKVSSTQAERTTAKRAGSVSTAALEQSGITPPLYERTQIRCNQQPAYSPLT